MNLVNLRFAGLSFIAISLFRILFIAEVSESLILPTPACLNVFNWSMLIRLVFLATPRESAFAGTILDRVSK